MMDNYSSEFDFSMSGELAEKITLGQIWENQPPIMHWCFGLTSLSFGLVYMLLCTML
jgi:hypothetical protein